MVHVLPFVLMPLGKARICFFSPLNYRQIVGQAELFSAGVATSLGEE